MTTNNDDKKPKSFMRRYERDPLKEFTNFNLAQSTVRIVDNIGFFAAKPQALELLARLMERYFEDMCKRIVHSKENSNRTVETLEDVDLAYKEMGVSLTEFQEYLAQVKTIPSVPQMPLYPFRCLPPPEPEFLKHPKPIAQEAKPEEYDHKNLKFRTIDFEEFMSKSPIKLKIQRKRSSKTS